MSVDQAVRDQYEALPYPARDPKDEKKRLITGSPSHPAEIRHHLFGGRLPDRPLSLLVAGGGTGDALVMMAQILKDMGRTGDRLVYLDQSRAARAIAEARMAARGLEADFVTGSLLDVATLAVGPFDYIDCCGVLHHLDSPAAGLAALTGVLAPEGGLGLMVYGTYGRRGVYDVQTILRAIAAEGSDSRRVSLARKLIQQLPVTNWLRRNPQITDHLRGDAAGLFDLLLHARDRSYSVPELLEWLAGARLRLHTWAEPARYEPATYLADAELKTAFARLPDAERWTQAELLAGGPGQHAFYATRSDHRPARPDPRDLSLIPVPHKMSGADIIRLAGPRLVLELEDAGCIIRRPLPPLAAALLPRMDGQTCWRDLFASLDRRDLDAARQAEIAEAICSALGGLNILLLRR